MPKKVNWKTYCLIYDNAMECFKKKFHQNYRYQFLISRDITVRKVVIPEKEYETGNTWRKLIKEGFSFKVRL